MSAAKVHRLPEIKPTVDIVEDDVLITECSTCDEKDSIIELIPCCKNCMRNFILTDEMWRFIALPLISNPVEFANSFNKHVDTINKTLEEFDFAPVKKLKLDRVIDLEESMHATCKLAKDLYID